MAVLFSSCEKPHRNTGWNISVHTNQKCQSDSRSRCRHCTGPESRANTTQILQEDTTVDLMLAALTDLNITGWPDSTQVVPEDLHPYWCFRDELTILDGLVMKENRVVIPSNMEPPIACMTHIRVSGQRFNVQDALCVGQSYRTTSLRLSTRAD